MKKITKRITVLVLLIAVLSQSISIRAETQEWTDGSKVTTDVTAEWYDEANSIANVTVKTSTTNKVVSQGVDYLFVLDMSGSMVFSPYGSSCLNESHFTWYPCTSQSDLRPARFTQEGDSWMAAFSDGAWRYLSGTEVANLSNYIFTTGYHRDANNTPIVRQYYDSQNVFYMPSWAGCQNRMNVVKSVVAENISSIANNGNPNCRVGTVMFGGQNFANWNNDFFNRNFSHIIDWINTTSYSAESGTIYYSWIDRAAYMLQTKVYQGDTRPTKLIFITDGSPTDSDIASYRDNNWVLQRANELKTMFPNMTLYTAGIGIGSTSWQSDFLRSIASDSSKYTTINESNATGDLSNMIQKVINSTKITTDSKAVYVSLDNSKWNFYGANASASTDSGGVALTDSATLQWNLSDSYSSGNTYTCTFLVQLTDSARMIYGNTIYPVTSSIRTHYRIRNGPLDLYQYDFHSANPALPKIPPTVSVSPIGISGGNLYTNTAGTYYVKDNTNFALSFTSSVPVASSGFAPNYNYFMSQVNSSHVQTIKSYLPMSSLSGGNGGTDLNTIQALMFITASNSRNSDYKNLTSGITVQMTQDKLQAAVYPMGEISNGTSTLDSTWWQEDKKLTLICDAKAPEVAGGIADREIDANTTLNFHAADDGSGMKADSFILSAKNTSTNETRTLATSTADISYTIDLNEAFFDGNILFTLQASDNVGNTATKEFTFTCNNMGLTASIYRNLEPHNPVFANGESGYVKIDVKGYVERVTVAFEQSQVEAASEEGKTLDGEYTLTPQKADHIDHVFCVPLKGKDGTYKVTVTAYKGEKSMKVTPDYTVNGTILDKFRTRIR